MYLKLRKLRESKKLTCAEMAKKLGYANRSVYSKKELGIIPLKLEEAKRISKILGVNISDIFL